MRGVRCVLGLALALFFGCSSFWPPVASEARIQSDLVGQKLVYDHSLLSREAWTIEKNDIKGWRLLRRATDRKAGADTVYAALRLEGVSRSISGNVKITYRLYDQGWQLETLSPDSEFVVVSAPKPSD